LQLIGFDAYPQTVSVPTLTRSQITGGAGIFGGQSHRTRGIVCLLVALAGGGRVRRFQGLLKEKLQQIYFPFFLAIGLTQGQADEKSSLHEIQYMNHAAGRQEKKG
jgi:hypothetical protein